MNAFVDTNVLVYAADETMPSSPKTRIAREILLLPDLHLSVQVLSEFVVNARHPQKLGFTPSQEADWIERWLRFPIAPLTEKTFVAALEIHQRFQLSHWDSLILACARELKCTQLYTQALNDGQDYGGVVAHNPFAQ